jgi:hypothetical protein
VSAPSEHHSSISSHYNRYNRAGTHIHFFSLSHSFILSSSSTQTSTSSHSSGLLLRLETMYTKRILIAALAGLASASPVEVHVRQLGGTGASSTEFSRGGCKDILFAFTRGSTEIGNMVCNYSMGSMNTLLTRTRAPSSDPLLPTVSSEPSELTRSPPRALPTLLLSEPTHFPAVPTPARRIFSKTP